MTSCCWFLDLIFSNDDGSLNKTALFPKKDSDSSAYIFDWCVLLLYEMFIVKCPSRLIGLLDWYEKFLVVYGSKGGALLMV